MSFRSECHTSAAIYVNTSGGSRGEVWGALRPLFLDEKEARKAEKIFFKAGPLPLSQGLDDRPPPLI